MSRDAFWPVSLYDISQKVALLAFPLLFTSVLALCLLKYDSGVETVSLLGLMAKIKV